MARAGSNANSNGNCVMDSDSPYLDHSGDHPGLTLVSHQLARSNYNTWKLSWDLSMEVFLDHPPLIFFLMCGIIAIIWSLLGS
ncbi:hypothetical protein AAG906_000809 [Vitis piasezkii]